MTLAAALVRWRPPPGGGRRRSDGRHANSAVANRVQLHEAGTEGRASPSDMASLSGLRRERARASKQWRDGNFGNTAPVGPQMKGNPLPLMKEYFFSGDGRVPSAPLPVERPHDTWATGAPSSGFRITWLGHSTMLLEMDGKRVLTDPVFGDRVSPVSFAGPKRFHEVPARLSELPKLDAILLSHDHFDHLCASTMEQVARIDVPVVTSLGVGHHLEVLGIPASRIVELDWWEHHDFGGGTLRFTAAPAQHFSGRGLTDRNTTLWSSWAIQTDRHKVFFSGDTGLTPEFADVGARLGPFDLSMIEIGAWHPAWGDIHLGPANALEAFRMLGGGTLLPVHWGTFNLALHDWNEPAETLVSLAEAASARIITPPLGRPVEPARIEAPTHWWRGVGTRS
jgi:L-ascorbate metabolism protein UlaG (beta-lactamase superfamily)